MAFERQQASMLILMSLLTLSFFTIKSAQASCKGEVAIYWGQNGNEGNLTSTCDTGNFDIVLLAHLHVFGCNKTPQFEFSGHCGDSWNPCTKLQSEIQHCQEKGVKVFLSLGSERQSSFCSAEDAIEFAHYLYENFLSGQSGPLGKVTLDGIDFHIEGGGASKLYWDDLAKELNTLRQQNNYFYLSAAPQCKYPDELLDKAIKTNVFNYILVKFYNNNLCQYTAGGGTINMLFKAWSDWTSSVLPNNTVLLGAPASPEAALGGGFIPSEELIADVLPEIKEASNYGGVMLWTRYYDVQTDPTYSDQIVDHIPSGGVALKAVKGRIADEISQCVLAALNRFEPKSSSSY